MHALQRKVNGSGLLNANFKKVAVVSHRVDLQTYKGVGDFVHSIVGTGNPLGKDGKRSAFIEEARCHLDVSLLIEYTGIDKDDEEILLEQVGHHLYASMKIAGGDILFFENPVVYKVEEGNDTDLRKLTRLLMPGHVIIERRELMIEAMSQGQDAIDSLLDYLAIHHRCEQDDDGNVTWVSQRKTSGWIVPIATGFHGISKLGEVKNQRDLEVSHRFAESLVTLGEFRMPHTINSLDEIFWCYHVDLEKSLYLCQQGNQI